MVLDVKNLVPGQSSALLGKTSKSNKKQDMTGLTESESVVQDSVNITDQASQISQLIAQMKAQPAIDPDRTSPIKEQLSQGQYEIKYQQVANKMLDFESGYNY